ncbi:MAG: helix-turn-helix domain-containing protein [Dehalococcoidia bacterium]
MKPKHTSHEMRRHLARRDRHGWTWAELSEQSGIPVSTLQWWRSRLAAEKPPEGREPDGFVEVAVVADVEDEHGHFEISLPDGCSVRVPLHFDSEALRQLLAVLSSRC